MSVEDTLKERGDRYGEFEDHAEISQALKDVVLCNENFRTMTANKKEAIEMILHKIARIVNGDPNYKDNWHDIQGYAKLAEDLCE